jgi:hypothetical protein
MIKRLAIPFACFGLLAAPAWEHTAQAQVAAPAAAVPAWIPPPAPAPPVTLWRFLGIPQGFQRIGDARLNRSGNFPGLERKPPLKPIAHPDNLLSNNPAIKKAAEIKMQEDLAKQKIKAIKYLAKMGCDKCYGGVKEALLAALDDCTEQVRYEAAKAIGEAAATHCNTCSRQCCCDEELTKKLAQIVYEMDDQCCPLEPSERVREMAREALSVCCPNSGPPGYVPEEVAPPVITPPPPEVPGKTGPETPPEAIPEVPMPLRNNPAAGPEAGLTPPSAPAVPEARIHSAPVSHTGLFLRSRADRMVATAKPHRSEPRQQRSVTRRVAQATQQQRMNRPAVQAVPIARRPEAAQVAVSDRAWPARPDTGETSAEASATDRPEPSSAIRIRVADNTAAVEQPAPAAQNDATSGSVVRIRDAAGDLQLTSASQPIAEATVASVVRPAIDAPNTAIATDEPPKTALTSRRALAGAIMPQVGAAATVTVQSMHPTPAVAGKGRISDIDSKSQTLQLSFPADQVPPKGTLVNVYHDYLFGEEQVGSVEVVGSTANAVIARPVQNLALNKISVNDEVSFDRGSRSNTGSRHTTMAHR